MDNEIKEATKAVQEIAKTTGQAIQAVDKIGSFFSRVMHESIETTCGMLSDTLKYKRWERQIKLVEKADGLIQKHGLTETMRPIKPKLALPIFQYASLEDDENLHDIWTRLLVTALDPSVLVPRNVFVDIIRQLESIDIKVLRLVHKNCLKKKNQHKDHCSSSLKKTLKLCKVIDNQEGKIDKIETFLEESNIRINNQSPTDFSCHHSTIKKDLNIDDVYFRPAIDNLMRQRLITSFVEFQRFDMDSESYAEKDLFIPVAQEYIAVCMTDFGVSFVEACILDEKMKWR